MLGWWLNTPHAHAHAHLDVKTFDTSEREGEKIKDAYPVADSVKLVNDISPLLQCQQVRELHRVVMICGINQITHGVAIPTVSGVNKLVN